eukprot:TRINITY_DN53559_c0_g1_i1.p1 TRINITY_DN53559_c0_g1~~TRINITY_DN53559_c0_g1_i1.p1  ORF type:complete len:107 (+),score=19.59 TRINITY_DN53559_c0_g1_i1:119-439(+)
MCIRDRIDSDTLEQVEREVAERSDTDMYSEPESVYPWLLDTQCYERTGKKKDWHLAALETSEVMLSLLDVPSAECLKNRIAGAAGAQMGVLAVSYTHLTLPTKRIV